MIEYDLTLGYGIVVSDGKMQEIKKALTDAEFDEVLDNYSRCIDAWTGNDYFIGIIINLPKTETRFVYRVSNFSIPSDDDEDLIDFKRFFDEHNLWKIIDWKPELLLINFCF